MKRLLSLLLVVVMLFAVLAMVGCGDDPEETTTAAPGTTATTGTSNTTGTTATTSDTTTSGTTATTSDTTTSDTTTPDTTKPIETTSSEPADDTTITSGTTVPLYARFDFGTDTKTEAEGKTSHEYIVSILTYDSSSLTIEFTEDTMVIWATKSYTSGMNTGAFAICFDNIVTYDFDEQLRPGWGAWVGYPHSTANVGKGWQGHHQYMKIRILNPTDNNMISMQFAVPGQSYSTTQIASYMFLQGGAPTSSSTDNLTATPTNEWKSYIYDIQFLAWAGRQEIQSGGARNYFGHVEDARETGDVGANNWNWQNSQEIASLRFHLLGAYGSGKADTRKNINQGDHVEVDYIIFGSSRDQLNAYTSYIEDSSNAA